MKVWKAKSNLANSGIIVREDYPNEMEQARRILRPIHNHALFLGMESRLVKDTLTIEGRHYTIKNIDTLPECLQPHNICQRTVSMEDGEYLLFFGKNNPLSNWYPANFMISGSTYTSSEQYFMYRKALFGKDIKRATQILETDDPQQVKKIGKAVKVDRVEWEIAGTAAMEEALKVKFEQNEHLKEFLLKTGHKVLVECSRDPFWGCGLHLHSKDAASRAKWKGENTLGVLLSQIRTSFR